MPKVVSDLEQAINQLRTQTDSPAVPPVAGVHPAYDPQFEALAEQVCKGVFRMLCEKNRAYGNSALDPIRIFSKAATDEQLNVRLDDKLSRVKRGHEYQNDDTLLDLIGYLIIKLVARKYGQAPS
jgi:hypothetical protein